MTKNRDIPDPIKRNLRKEAGFGCCICGYLFIEYHHIHPFAETEEHDEKHMMVLCPNHHHQANILAIDNETQYSYKKSPYNITRNCVDGQLIISSKVIAVEVGSIQLIGAGFKFIVDQVPLLELKRNGNGHLLLSMDLYDPNDTLLISIADNEWISGDPLPWDFEYRFNYLKLRRKDRIISIEIDARTEPLRLYGNLYYKKQNFGLKRDQLLFNGVVKTLAMRNLALVASYLSADTKEQIFKISSNPGFGKGMFVSWPDPKERLQKGIQAYKQLIKNTKVGRNDPCPCGSGRKAKNCCL